MKYYIYIIYSGKLDRFYIGYSESPQTRLIKHNQKHKGYTGRANDWELVYTESFDTKEAAKGREKQLKSWKDRSLIESLIKDL